MNKRINFKNMEHAEVLRNFANQHLEKIEKLLESERTPIDIDLTLEPGQVHAHNKVTLHVRTAEFSLMAHHEGKDFYQEINTVIDKMVQEVRRAKEKKAQQDKTKDRFKSA